VQLDGGRGVDQEIVAVIDEDLDLRSIYNRAGNDPIFTLGPDATIEDPTPSRPRTPRRLPGRSWPNRPCW
jgi:hypothetical protein